MGVNITQNGTTIGVAFIADLNQRHTLRLAYFTQLWHEIDFQVSGGAYVAPDCLKESKLVYSMTINETIQDDTESYSDGIWEHIFYQTAASDSYTIPITVWSSLNTSDLRRSEYQNFYNLADTSLCPPKGLSVLPGGAFAASLQSLGPTPSVNLWGVSPIKPDRSSSTILRTDFDPWKVFKHDKNRSQICEGEEHLTMGECQIYQLAAFTAVLK
jgi:hypothetical protein